MAKYRWPTDPPGKKPSHSIPWSQHIQNSGYGVTGQLGPQGRNALAPPSAPGEVPYNPVKGITGNNPAPVIAPVQPFDPYLASTTLAAQRNVGLADADAAWAQGQLQRSSGFDAAGNLVAAGTKDFNPFSQAQLLQDEYRRSQAGTLNSYAAMGQYNSGAYGRARERDSRLYAQGYDQLKTGTLGGYRDISRQRLGTYADNSIGVDAASYDALRRALGFS